MLLALVSASAGVWFANWHNSQNADPLDSVQAQLQQALVFPADYKQVPEFQLIDKTSAPVTETLFKDHWSMTFFGFTHCPDVCPLTMTIMSEVKKQLAESHPELPAMQVVFVSVDPKRDTPEQLQRYIDFFDPGIKALTGELDNVFQLTQPLNIVVSFIANEENPEYYTVCLLYTSPSPRDS